MTLRGLFLRSTVFRSSCFLKTIPYNTGNIVSRRYNTTRQINDDTKHFFTNPKKSNGNVDDEIMKSYRRMQNRRNLQTGMIILSSLFITIFGYQVIYKVVIKKQESFVCVGLRLCKTHKLSQLEKKYIDIQNLQKLIERKVMSKIVSNDFIKEQYEIPLKIIEDDDKKQFKIWGEDENPVLYGITIRPYDSKKPKSRWHNFGNLIQWRFSQRSINIIQIMDSFLINIGIGYDKITIPETQYDSFMHESPIHYIDDDDDVVDNMDVDRCRHICFIGEFSIDSRSSVIYKGKYHVDVKFDEIYVMRKEDNENVKYIIYKGKKRRGEGR